MVSDLQKSVSDVPTSASRTMTIDCDVHESFTSLKDLLPYLEEPWRRLTNKWKGFSTDFAYWTAQSTSSQTASSYDLMREDLLDKYDINIAILTGYFYPSMMKTQFEFASALAAAYNDFMVENWLTKDSRFRGSIHIAPQDPKAAVKEIDRLASHPQIVQVLFPIDYKAYGEPQYHPIFEAAQRNNLRVAFHHSTIAYSAFGPGRYSIERHMNLPHCTMAEISSLICGGVFNKFPDLKFLFLEGGFSWLPHVLWRFDREYKSLRAEIPWVKELPSRYIRERCRFSTQPSEDINAKQWMMLMELMDSDEMLVFSTDYPHYDFDTPEQSLPSGLPQDIKEKILYKNAEEFYKDVM